MKKKANILAYLASPLMSAMVLVIASVIFIVVLKDFATVTFFGILIVIDLICKTLFALLPDKIKTVPRHVSQFLVGSLIFVMAGLLGQQNFNIEGFFFFVLAGTFGGTIVHFLNGKVLGPILSGRNFCGWSCWTTMILDLFPYKKGSEKRAKGLLSYFRYFYFAAALVLIAVLVWGFKYYIHNPAPVDGNWGTVRAFYWFAVASVLYYAIGIALIFIMKDNRAFCKYICPASLLLKASSSIALLKIKGDKNSCNNCGDCAKQCKMDIKVNEYVQEGSRVTSNECIMCLECVAACPKASLKASVGFDVSTKNKLR